MKKLESIHLKKFENDEISSLDKIAGGGGVRGQLPTFEMTAQQTYSGSSTDLSYDEVEDGAGPGPGTGDPTS